MASLGGNSVKRETFALLTSSVESVANLTQGAATFLEAHQLDGIEVDWRWPTTGKDKEDLTTLVKVRRGREDGRAGKGVWNSHLHKPSRFYRLLCLLVIFRHIHLVAFLLSYSFSHINLVMFI